MDWGTAENTESKGTKIPDNWLHLYYYEALNILFRFENALRIFVYVILKRELGSKWDNAAIGDGITIRTETKKRLAQAREFGYLGYEVTSPMLYLNSGELTQIIISEAYWKYFAQYFKATKSIVLTKLQEIGTVRNSLAHFRPLKSDDLDLVKQNSKHVLQEIEKCLVQITAITTTVPTNHDEDWYKELKSIGNPHLSTALYFSRDRDWIRLELIYKAPNLSKQQFGDAYFSYSLPRFKTSRILTHCKAIKDYCIYISENHPYGTLQPDFSIDAPQRLSIIFSRDCLVKNLSPVVTDLRDLATKAEAETNLVIADNLAMGELIDVKGGSAALRKNGNEAYWQVDVSNVKTDLAEVEDVEFWGQRWQWEGDFIAATSLYPWMPSTVSRQGFL